MATTALRYVTAEQVAAYRRSGYLAIQSLIDRERVEALRRVTDEFVERSRQVTKTDAVFVVDSKHSAQRPVVHRIKNPADNHPLYHWVAFESPIADIVAELVGPDIKFHHSKLNIKGSEVGAPVDWHQDAAFYPHSNDDVLAVGLLLDDATAENGALQVVGGSQFGPVYDHYDGGRFVGKIRREDLDRAGVSKAELLALPAGSIHIHHYRLVHGSEPNTSPNQRRLLINAYSAADAINFVTDNNKSALYGKIVRGQPAKAARRDAGDMPMPPTWGDAYTSIYEVQGATSRMG